MCTGRLYSWKRGTKTDPYSRLQNPTNDHVAAKIAALEGGTAAGVPTGLIRISCGLEDKKDLIADISQALESI